MYDQEGAAFLNIHHDIGEILVNRTVKNVLKGSTLVSAGTDTGQGIYEITLPNDALELTVNPGTTYAGDYKFNITWSLLPGN